MRNDVTILFFANICEGTAPFRSLFFEAELEHIVKFLSAYNRKT